MNNEGLNYICNTWERFSAICNVLTDVLKNLKKSHSNDSNHQKIFKHIITCFLKLSEKPENKEKLINFIPKELIENSSFMDDKQNRDFVEQIKMNLGL
jgi:CCR4-NOT transcription complex subunit 9